MLLVGFMGAGKSTVGRALADALGWDFLDFDTVVEEEAGATVAEIFDRHGEAHFRAVEDRVARRLLELDAVVLASGGGWAAASGHLREVPQGTVTIWLQVTAETAVARSARQPGRRPLLDSEGATHAAADLLAARVDSYGLARWAVDTEHSTVEDVTARILGILAREDPRTEAE